MRIRYTGKDGGTGQISIDDDAGIPELKKAMTDLLESMGVSDDEIMEIIYEEPCLYA